MNISVDKFKPLNNMLLVQRDKEETQSTKTLESGLIVVNSEENKPKNRDSIATVIKVGDYVYDKFGNRHDLKEIFHPGDRVIYYNPAGGTEIIFSGETYLLLRAEDIDGIITD